MSLNFSQQTLGYILIVLGIIVAITGYISYRKGGKMKVITYVVFVIAALGFGIKFAFTPEKKPLEIKEVVLPKNPGRN
jgi:hypothetical protein